MGVGSDVYLWVKTLHIVSIITWMAGLFYLPRLYVYHAQEEVGSQTSETFKVMERRLLKAIMNPSLVVATATGVLMMWPWISQGWFHIKFLMVIGMIVMHMLYARWRRAFEEDRNTHSHVFYRYMNEVPTVLMLVIIPMVILKPFLG